MLSNDQEADIIDKNGNRRKVKFSEVTIGDKILLSPEKYDKEMRYNNGEEDNKNPG
jgi:hypothetical protein